MDTPLEQATRLVESERAQLAHEIHDGLLPLIFAASAGLDQIRTEAESNPAVDRQRIDQIADWIEQAMRAGRRLLTDAYPPELEGGRWSGPASEALKQLFPDTQTQLNWVIDPSIEPTSMPMALAAYRIVVEAVRNGIEHGRATEVHVDGSRDEREMRITITDNGSGFDPASIASGHFGVRAMHDRASLVGGHLRVESQSGGPTTVTFTAPATG